MVSALACYTSRSHSAGKPAIEGFCSVRCSTVGKSAAGALMQHHVKANLESRFGLERAALVP